MQHDFTKQYCSQCQKSKYQYNSNGELILYCHSRKTKVKFLDRNDTRATDCRWFVPERKEELLRPAGEKPETTLNNFLKGSHRLHRLDG